MNIVYPDTRRDEKVEDDYHGHKVNNVHFFFQIYNIILCQF